MGIDFVRAVNGQGERQRFFQRNQGDAELPGQRRGILGGGHAADVEAAADALTQRLDERRGSAARAQADGRACRDKLQGTFKDGHRCLLREVLAQFLELLP